MEQNWEQWMDRLLMLIDSLTSLGNHLKKEITDRNENEQEASDFESDNEETMLDEDGGNESDELLDVEDMGKVATKLQEAVNDFAQSRSSPSSPLAKRSIGGKLDNGSARIQIIVEDAPKKPLRAMVTPALEKNLTKQGYKIIGSHSGVKICRWTKSMLRGRGGCYKHTFYGIASHQCMETTPSLACGKFPDLIH